jgi:hypothetical protein
MVKPVLEQLDELLKQLRLDYAESKYENEKLEIADRGRKIRAARDLLIQYREKNQTIAEIVKEEVPEPTVDELASIFTE